MPRGIALTVGLNSVDPGAYDSYWSGALGGAEADADAVKTILENEIKAGQPFTLVTMRGQDCRRDDVMQAINEAGRQLTQGDLFLLYFAGHGGIAKSILADAGPIDTMCLHDGMILDIELGDAWCGFEQHTNIVLIADCCHSGTISYMRPDVAKSARTRGIPQSRLSADHARTRRMPTTVASVAYTRQRGLYEQIQREVYSRHAADPKGRERHCNGTRSALKSIPPVKATVLQLAACLDRQNAEEDDTNEGTRGAFTWQLERAWRSTHQNGSWCRLFEEASGNFDHHVQQPSSVLISPEESPSLPSRRAFSVV